MGGTVNGDERVTFETNDAPTAWRWKWRIILWSAVPWKDVLNERRMISV